MTKLRRRRDPDLAGRVILITGGNSGIGLEAAVRLATMGAQVVIACRDPQRGADALARIRRRSANPSAELVDLDLASFASIRRCAEEVLDRFSRLDVLVNNAGAVLSHRLLTDEGYEMTFGVNHLGHFLLTDLLLDRLRASAPSRVVTVASLAHRWSTGISYGDLQREQGYVGWDVYGDSKLANVLFTRELAARLHGTGVTANCLHPGIVRSGFGGKHDTSGPDRLLMMISRPFFISAKRGARTVVHLASSPEVEEVTGGYFSHRRQWRPSAAARDDAQARRLWEVSEELVAAATST